MKSKNKLKSWLENMKDKFFNCGLILAQNISFL